MLYLILALSIGLVVFGLYVETKYDNYDVQIVAVLGLILAVVDIVVMLICGAGYNLTASTAQSKLAVLQEQNEIVLAQVQPIVEQYTQYENSTLEGFKMSPEKVVALCAMYPELKSNKLFSAQVDIIVENQREIKNVKLEIASLNAYHMWLWTPIRY